MSILTNQGSSKKIFKILLLVLPTTVYLALGSSCTGDVARLQSHINFSGTDAYEPGSSMALELLKYVFLYREVSILHGLAQFMLCLYVYYFIVIIANKGRLGFAPVMLYFLCIFNPISFELVAHNTRQMFSVGLLMLAIICLDTGRRQKRVINNFPAGSSEINNQSSRVLLTLTSIFLVAYSFSVHTTTPGFILFLLLWALVSAVTVKSSNIFGVRRFIKHGKIKRLNAAAMLVGILIVPLAYYIISNKGLARIAIYFVIQNNPEYNLMAFDFTSITLVTSLVFTILFLCVVIFLKNTSPFIKSLSIALLVWLFVLVLAAYFIPQLSEISRRLYQPLILLSFPVLISNISETALSNVSKFLSIFILLALFGASAILQFQKLITSNSILEKDPTFYSLNNTMENSCMLLRGDF